MVEMDCDKDRLNMVNRWEGFFLKKNAVKLLKRKR